MSKEINAIREEIIETLQTVAKEKRTEYRYAVEFFNQGYRARVVDVTSDVDLFPYIPVMCVLSDESGKVIAKSSDVPPLEFYYLVGDLEVSGLGDYTNENEEEIFSYLCELSK